MNPLHDSPPLSSGIALAPLTTVDHIGMRLTRQKVDDLDAWSCWEEAWLQATYPAALGGLIHDGLKQWSTPDSVRRHFAPAYCFFLQIADGHVYSTAERKREVEIPVKKKLSELAFQMLCNQVFTLDRTADSENYLWLPYLDTVEAIRRTMWFINKKAMDRICGNCTFLKPDQTKALQAFMEGFVRMHWNIDLHPRHSYSPIEGKILKNYLNCNQPYLMRWLFNFGWIHLLRHVELTEGNCNDLENIILTHEIFVKRDLRPPVSLAESLAYGDREKHAEAVNILVRRRAALGIRISMGQKQKS